MTCGPRDLVQFRARHPSVRTRHERFFMQPGCPQDFDLDGEVGLGNFLTLLDWYNLGQQRGDIADDFGNPGPDGHVSFGDFLALLTFIGPC